MPRHNPTLAAVETRVSNRGPITEHLLAREEHQQERYGSLGRPSRVLDALRRSEPVAMSTSLIPRRLWPSTWDLGMRVVVTPEM
jgi:hypothetical protein